MLRINDNFLDKYRTQTDVMSITKLITADSTANGVYNKTSLNVQLYKEVCQKLELAALPSSPNT